MKHRIFASLYAAALVGSVAFGAAAASYPGSQLERQAKVSLTKARQIAVAARPGKILDQELEKEAGGSGLRYAFDIASGPKTYEVGVDAMTGKVLENGVETAAQEKAELKAEATSKAKKK